MKKITVRFDLDGVLNTFDQHVVDLHYQRTGEKIKADKWGFHTNSVHGEEVWAVTREPNFFYTCPVQEHAQETMYYMEENSSIYEYFICSSFHAGFGDSMKYVHEQKSQWLFENFGSVVADKLILVEGSKKDYPADIIIDDYFKNIQEANEDALKIFYRQKHNADLDSMFEKDKTVIRNVKNHKQLVDLLKRYSQFGSRDEFLEDYNR